MKVDVKHARQSVAGLHVKWAKMNRSRKVLPPLIIKRQDIITYNEVADELIQRKQILIKSSSQWMSGGRGVGSWKERRSIYA